MSAVPSFNCPTTSMVLPQCRSVDNASHVVVGKVIFLISETKQVTIEALLPEHLSDHSTYSEKFKDVSNQAIIRLKIPSSPKHDLLDVIYY